MDRKELQDYFLGDMDTAATEKLESRMFEDNDLFYELVDLENEIADAYLNGSLDDDTRIKVEEKAAASPGFAEKLRNAKALHSHLAESSIRVSDVAGSQPEEVWLGRMMARMGLSSLGAPAMVSGALLIAVTGLAAFLLYDRIRLGREMARIKSEQQTNYNTDTERIRELENKLADVEKREKDLGTKLDQNQGQSEIVEEQLAKERSERVTLQRELNRIKNREMNRGNVPQARIATLVLSPFVLNRGRGDGVKSVELPPGANRLKVTLQIPESISGNRFSVTYKGRSILTGVGASTTSTGTRFVVATLRATDLTVGGDNVLRIISDEGVSATYVFTVEQ